MKAARVLRNARRRAGFSQRQLAFKTGVPQPSIARIESGRSEPRVQMLDALLRACGEELEAIPRRGRGVDRTLIQSQLSITPSERSKVAIASSRNMARLVEEIRRNLR